MTGIDPERWSRIEGVFHQALDQPPGDRVAFLDAACAGDPELRQAVEELLQADEGTDGFLEVPAVSLRGAYGGPDEDDRIGPYRLIRPIGAGGMGQVFLGLEEGPDFRRYAAIKVAHMGIPPDFFERFARERAILAQLEHAGIARFLGGGTTPDGRPYVAMEYVQGERIDRFADRERLTIRERVDLFRQVCLAVQYAHANLIVHRDLKPDNILVTPGGDPKLLDFGIAKLLGDDQGDLTRTGLRLATPAYAAPEQLRGEAVSTAADVFALGAVLYELLAGHRAFPGARAAARAEGVDTGPPAAPSSITAAQGSQGADGPTAEEIGDRRRLTPAGIERALRSELDNIVLKAMAHDPAERYVSAAALSDDLERYLNGEPVRARPPSVTYRFKKFAGRNRAAVTAAAALVITLAGWTVATLRQNRLIREQAAQLESDRDRAREVQGFLLESFGSVGGDDVAGDSVTVRQVLDARAGQVDALYADEPTLRAEMFHVLADGYERLGILEEAQRWAERAVEERRSLASGSAEADLAGSLGLLGWVRHQQGDLEEAEARLEESVERWRGIQTDSAGLARALNDLCGVYTTLGRFEEAEALCVEAMAIRRDIYPPNHRAIAVTANNLGNAVGSQGRRDESLEWAQESARILEAALGRRHRRTLFALRNVAVGHAWLGDWERSAQMSREIADAYEELGGPLDIDLAWSLQSYGAALGRLGRIQEADSVLSRGYEIASTRLGDHPLTAYLLDQRRGLMQRDGRRPEALDLARRSLDMYRRLYPDDHPDVATGLTRVGELATDPSEAVEAYEAAAGMLGRLEGEGGQGAVRATLSLARALLADDRPADALSLFDSLEASIPEAFGTDHPFAVAPYLGRAQAHAALGDRGAAGEWLIEARERLVGGVDVEANQRWLEEVVQAVQR